MKLRKTMVACTIASLVACTTPVYEGKQPTMLSRHPHTHMEENVRATIETVVVVPHTDTAEMGLFGSYAGPTFSPTLAGIRTAWFPIEFAIETITTEGPGALPAEFVIPYVVLPFMLYGTVKQAIKNQIQELRDEMADQLTRSAGRPVSNTVMAQDLYSTMRTVPGLDANVIAETTPLPEGTDAVLLVRLTEIVVEVLEEEANIRTGATAMLRRVSDGRVLYTREYHYKDRDTLRNWIENDAALWEDYMNFARYYFARQITADFFEKIELRHDLYPIPTDSTIVRYNDNWQLKSYTTTPELSWKHIRLGRDTYPPWELAFGEDDTYFDLEIYDKHRIVYTARNVPDSNHQLAQPLPACRELRWTVRPSYRMGDRVMFGEWMRYYSNVDLTDGYEGSKASQTPAYTRGFAVLRTPCEKP